MIRSAALHAFVAQAAVLLLAACSSGRASSPTGPAPMPVAPREELAERPRITDVELVAVQPSLLGSVAYDLPLEANTWVAAELEFLVEERREVIGRWLEKGDPYEPFIKRVLQLYELPTDLFHLAMIESGFAPTVRSRAGAVGMWQFMPATGRSMGLRVDDLVDERMDPVRATDAAARHLRALYRQFGDWALATSAYNAGSGRISRGLQGFGVDNFWDLAQQGDLAAETKHYVPRLYAATVIARDRERFGFAPPRPADYFAFDSVNVEYATPLSVLAEVSGVAEERLARLNPHLLRGITPEGGYWVWVPAGRGVEVQRAYLASDFRREGGQGVYVVRSGDYLGRIAERSGVKMGRIRELNPGVDWDRLPIGTKVSLPFRAAQALTARPEERREEVTGAGYAAKPTPAPVAATEGRVIHRVEPGETLWGLARAYGVTVGALRQANDLAGEVIRPGQSLQVPGQTVVEAAPRATEHVVQSGDSLWSIARRYDRTVAALQDANDLGTRSTILPGQTLIIPVAAPVE